MCVYVLKMSVPWMCLVTAGKFKLLFLNFYFFFIFIFLLFLYLYVLSGVTAAGRRARVKVTHPVWHEGRIIVDQGVQGWNSVLKGFRDMAVSHSCVSVKSYMSDMVYMVSYNFYLYVIWSLRRDQLGQPTRRLLS